jgi:hypothetical protein
MRMITGFLAAASIGALSSALAMEPPASSTPPTSQSAPEPAAQRAAPVSTQAAAASTTTATIDTKADSSDQATKVVLTAGDADAAAQLKRLKAAGYKPEIHGSEVWFCRKEVIMGTRLEKKVCNTADQLQRQEADARQMTDHLQRRISGDPHDGGHP